MDFLNKVKKAGVIGAGGAGFPTHVKLASKAEYIILNGAECEPLIQTDAQLMKEYPYEIIKGFEMARKFVGADKGLIGIKKKHENITANLKKVVANLELEDCINIRGLDDIYPIGDEAVLVYELTGRIVPELGIPISVGCVVINVETALNLYYASMGKPVVEKYITVTGDVPNSLTIKAPVGTPIIDILKLSGIEDFEGYRVINGGPMMGFVMKDLNGYITKTTNGFVILKEGHYLIRRKSIDMERGRKISRSVCEQCRMCTDICPRHLMGHNMEPHKIMRALNYSLPDLGLIETVQLCSECNLCELFSCQPGLYPRMVNRYYKEKLTYQNKRYVPGDKELKALKNREYRLVSSERLIARLGLMDFYRPAPMTKANIEPNIVRISTKQHIGVPVVPTVSIGDSVELGQPIGEAVTGNIWASIHASIEGTVVNRGKDFVEIRRI